jgi:hypothetical protein
MDNPIKGNSMNLDQALSQIIAYSVANGLESLSAIERMVKQFKTLSPEQQEAVTVFMAETKVDA